MIDPGLPDAFGKMVWQFNMGRSALPLRRLESNPLLHVFEVAFSRIVSLALRLKPSGCENITVIPIQQG